MIKNDQGPDRHLRPTAAGKGDGLPYQDVIRLGCDDQSSRISSAARSAELVVFPSGHIFLTFRRLQ